MRAGILSIYFIFWALSSVTAQNIDSLTSVWNNQALPDSARYKAIDELTWNTYLFTIPDSALFFARQHWQFSLYKQNDKQISSALNTIGVAHYIKGDFDSALFYFNACLNHDKKTKDWERIGSDYNNIGLVKFDMTEFDSAVYYYNKSLEIAVRINDESGIAGSYNNIGRVYQEQGNFSLAIISYTNSLKIKEKINDLPGTARAYNNIGTVYYLQKQVPMAIGFYEKSLALSLEIQDDYQVAGTSVNLATVYLELHQLDSALSKCALSIRLRKEIDDQPGLAESYNTLGKIFQEQNQLDSARYYLEKSLGIREKIEDLMGQSHSLNALGDLALKQNDFQNAVVLNQRALKIAQENELAQIISDAAFSLYIAYKKLGNSAQSLEMYELHIQTRDSIFSQTNQQEIIRQEYKYEYEKNAAADSVSYAKQQEINQAQIDKQNAEISKRRNQQYALAAGLLLILIFSAFLYNRFKLTQRQKQIIEDQKKLVEEQKELVEEKNKEVFDSINYAKRLQQAILPSERRLKEYLNQYFVYYQPKDIVAGDFYWAERKGESIFFAAADCTGHGVPGALVSVVCSNALNRTVNEFGITEPGAILDKVRELVIETFSKNETEVKDGMDISLCMWNGSKRVLKWAGANNPLWLIRNQELTEYKANKQPVGYSQHAEPFRTHTISIQENDLVYLFTDGYQDQFGGEKGKKYKAANLKLLLQKINQKSLSEQELALKTELNQWRGNLEQVDDVCVLGIRF